MGVDRRGHGAEADLIRAERDGFKKGDKLGQRRNNDALCVIPEIREAAACEAR